MSIKFPTVGRQLGNCLGDKNLLLYLAGLAGKPTKRVAIGRSVSSLEVASQPGGQPGSKYFKLNNGKQNVTRLTSATS